MSRKQRSQQKKRAEQARENGARSNGPITSAGKRESSLNALKHGLASNAIILLEGESREKLAEIIAGAIDTYRPQNPYEVALTEAHISAFWRSRRAAAFETAIFNVQMQLDAPELKKQFTVIDPTTRQALTFKTLSQSTPSPQQLARYEAELCRSSKRWLDMLKDAQQIRRANEIDDQLLQAVPQNEPSPPLISTNAETCQPESAPTESPEPQAGPNFETHLDAVPENKPSAPATPASSVTSNDTPHAVPPQPARIPKLTPEQVLAESRRVRETIGYHTGYYPKE